MQPLVSVIIPVYNDSSRLKICLTQLNQQTLPQHFYEVIVVDNGSQEDTGSVVQAFSKVKLVREEKPGSYVARNKGIEAAQGQILVFTDSDCVPTPTWLENGVNFLKSTPNCGLVAGRIDLFFQDPNHPNAIELYNSLEMDFIQEQLLKTHHFGVTANLFTFKSIVDHVGSFNSELKSGGDREWGNRVFQAGYAQVYADNVQIHHPARRSFQELYKRVTRLEGGKFDRIKTTTPSHEIIKSLIFQDLVMAVTPPFRKFFRIWADPRLTNQQQKVQYTTVMLFIRYVSAWERIRLKLGGISRRG